jgi:pimeloyl-ACP methyl ester carboxylesterase
LDLRGYGKSSLNNKTSNSADLAHDVVRFCEIKNFKKVTLIGWSLGGVVCMKIA